MKNIVLRNFLEKIIIYSLQNSPSILYRYNFSSPFQLFFWFYSQVPLELIKVISQSWILIWLHLFWMRDTISQILIDCLSVVQISTKHHKVWWKSPIFAKSQVSGTNYFFHPHILVYEMYFESKLFNEICWIDFLFLDISSDLHLLVYFKEVSWAFVRDLSEVSWEVERCQKNQWCLSGDV